MQKKIKRLVIKVGTSTVTNNSGELDRKKIRSIAEQISRLHSRGLEIILVTSGSVAAGLKGLNWTERPKDIKKLQAAASIGQSLLMQIYNDVFSKYDISIGQILITQQDMMHRQQYLNIQNTIATLLKLNAIPIINENDTTSVEELKFGDNDTLAALVTNLAEASQLIILTNLDGMFDKDPAKYKDATLITEIKEITAEVEAGAGGAGTKFGSGGMATKVRAAKIAGAAGKPTVIANGSTQNILEEIMAGKPIGTKFHASVKRLGQRKLWIAYAAAPMGSVCVDSGARAALIDKGRSLLPAGVTKVDGDFSVGDIINIFAGKNVLVARGISNYSSGEMSKIMGLQTKEARKVLKNIVFEEVVHRDCLVLL